MNNQQPPRFSKPKTSEILNAHFGGPIFWIILLVSFFSIVVLFIIIWKKTKLADKTGRFDREFYGEDHEAPDAFGEDSDEDDEDGLRNRKGKMSKADKKALKKGEKKKEKQERREALAQPSAKKQREEEYRKRREEKEKEREKAEEEAEEQLRKEKEKQEQEEYMKWKDLISVEASGEEPEFIEGNVLSEFINYIKQKKVVQLDDLAAHFKLRTIEAIDRVQLLEQSGRLTGVMDDRGKYIYITEEELDHVSHYIKKKGRVSISAIAAESRNLIKLAESSDASIKS